MPKTLIAAALALSFWPASARAGLVTMEFESVVRSIRGEELIPGFVAVGDTLRSTFSWDTRIPPIVPDPDDQGVGLSFRLGDTVLGPEVSLGPPGTFRRPGASYFASLTAGGFPGRGDNFSLRSFVDVDDWPTAGTVSLSAFFFDADSTALGGTALPSSLELADLETAQVGIGGTGWFVSSEVTRLLPRPIPEPSAALAFVAGLALVGAVIRLSR